jgi:hypothetical protein
MTKKKCSMVNSCNKNAFLVSNNKHYYIYVYCSLYALLFVFAINIQKPIAHRQNYNFIGIIDIRFTSTSNLNPNSIYRDNLNKKGK